MKTIFCLFLFVVLLQGCVQPGGVKDIDLIKAAQLNTDLGLGYLQQGHLGRAEHKLKRALELDNQNASTHLYLAEVYGKLDDPEYAEKYYLLALAVAPSDAMILNNYGAFLCGQSRFDESEVFFLKAIDTPRYRTPELSYENIALCAMRMDDVDKAEMYFRKVLAVDANRPRALYNLAQMSYRKGDFLRARGFLQRLYAGRSMTEKGLLLGIKVESALGNEEAVARYSQALEKTMLPAEAK